MVDKETSTLLKGYMYPSSHVARCPRYHRCTISGKCQTYDAHQPDCAVCETRVYPPGKLGGLLPEGKYMPDLQDAMHTLEEMKRTPFAHRDQPGQTLENPRDITNKYDRMRKSIDMCKMFLDEGVWNMEEKVVNALYDTNTKQLLGRLD